VYDHPKRLYAISRNGDTAELTARILGRCPAARV